MKTHTIEGQFLLDRVGGLLGPDRRDRPLLPRALGRPGLSRRPRRARQIPLAARIVFVCDAYNAMTTDRPYRQAARARPPRSRSSQRNAGTQFDPHGRHGPHRGRRGGRARRPAADDMRALLSEVRLTRRQRPAALLSQPPPRRRRPPRAPSDRAAARSDGRQRDLPHAGRGHQHRGCRPPSVSDAAAPSRASAKRPGGQRVVEPEDPALQLARDLGLDEQAAGRSTNRPLPKPPSAKVATATPTLGAGRGEQARRRR